MATSRGTRATILDAKLRPPHTLRASVYRQRLLAPLAANEHPERAVTVVSASAGAGKTVLLAQWWRYLRGKQAPAAWLSLDGYDNDSLTFWSGILATCRNALTGTPSATRLGELRPPVSAADPGFLAAFYEAIAPLDGDMWLILDDAHEITASSVLEGLSRLLRTAPAELKVMLGCRFDPPLPLPRLQLEGNAGEIRAAELAFDHDEARELLGHHGIDLTDSELELLIGRTEGWAAGLELAAMSLAQQNDVGKYLETFAGDDQPVADYLVSEVLSRLPAETKSFLLVTAVPERVTLGLARELSGRADAGAVLEQLSRDNALVHRQESRPRRYQYHSLLRTYLLAELQRRDATVLRRLHTAAADWFAGRGAAREALEHAVAAEAWHQVVRLVDRHGLRLVLTGQFGALAQAFAAVPDDVMSDLRVALVAAMAALHQGRLAEAHTHLARIERDPSRHNDSRMRLLHVTALLHEARLRGQGSPRVRRLIELTQAQIVDDPDLQAVTTAGRGMALIVLGELGAGGEDLSYALRLAQEQHLDLLALDCLSYLALSAAAAGDAQGMVTRVEAAIEFATERGWAHSPAMVRIYLGAAWAAWNSMHRDRVERLMVLMGSIDAAVEPSVAQSVRILAAYVEFERTGGRRQLIDRISNVWSESGAAGGAARAVSHYCIQDLRTALAIEDPAWAQKTMERARRLLGAETPDVTVMGAMLDVSIGEQAAARASLAAIVAGEAACHSTTAEIVAWMLEAQLADANDQPVQAHDALVRAVELAGPLRAIRVLATASEQIRRLLIRGRGRFGRHDEFVAEVLVAARDSSGGLDHLRHGETLTPRELGLLRNLPSIQSLEGIAEAHGISVNTVKTHLRALYRKLDVTSRRDAVARGGELGLL